MKYRSFNEEFLISTALIINVFNDIIIDRRSHGTQRDYNKPISLKEIAQKEIEVPCIVGNRSIILKSLENEQGKYKLPLIILENKSIKTDINRMVDLHSDIFYQQDISFAKLDTSNPLYRPQQISKRRGQPVTMDFDMTIITKYKEDLDQIISNWIVHFRPDIYVKWWHPRIKTSPLDSQILWNQNVGFDSNVEYSPTNIFTYKASTSFSFKSWVFPGMHSIENAINPDSESIIKKIKFFPNRTSILDNNGEYNETNDSNDLDDIWYFGDIGCSNEDSNLKNSDLQNIGDFSFYGVDKNQSFYNNGEDIDGIKNGNYMVNNIYANNNEILSGNQTLLNMKNNPLVGDMFTNYEKFLLSDYHKKFQSYLEMDKSLSLGTSIVKNVYFKGGFPDDSMRKNQPSGDFLFKQFYSTYHTKSGKIIKSEMGQSFLFNPELNINYDINSKDLIVIGKYKDPQITFNAKSVYNSKNGIYQEFDLTSERIYGNYISLYFSRGCNNQLEVDENKCKTLTHNCKILNKDFIGTSPKFLIENKKYLDLCNKIYSIFSISKNSMELIEKEPQIYEIIFKNIKMKDILRNKEIDDINFTTFNFIHQEFLNNKYYQLMVNKYMYLVLEVDSMNKDDADIYDFGMIFPLQFESKHAIIYEITIPESRLLLGLNLTIGI